MCTKSVIYRPIFFFYIGSDLNHAKIYVSQTYLTLPFGDTFKEINHHICVHACECMCVKYQYLALPVCIPGWSTHKFCD